MAILVVIRNSRSLIRKYFRNSKLKSRPGNKLRNSSSAKDSQSSSLIYTCEQAVNHPHAASTNLI